MERLGALRRSFVPAPLQTISSQRSSRFAVADRLASGDAGSIPSGLFHRFSLRFLDASLEASYQRFAGAEGRGGVRLIAGASALLWMIAAGLIPLGTHIPSEIAVNAGLAMSAISSAAMVVSYWADTLNRQHLIVALLTSFNGLVVLTLASYGGVLPGYGVSAALLLFAYGFVSRTRFVFALLRSVIVAIGFAVAALTYAGPGTLVIDAFLLSAGIIGMQLALYQLERSRRRVFHQGLVIEQQSRALATEKDKSDQLLSNVLPAKIASRLRNGEVAIADEYPSVSILFADIVGFTPMAAQMSPAAVIDVLSSLFTTFDELVAERGLEKIKTMGDSYMAAGGLPEPLADHAARTVDLGLAMIRAAARESTRENRPTIGIRIGIHSGPVVGGVIGSRKFAFDVWGTTVNVASRLESHGLVNRVHVSRDTWLMVKDQFAAESRGSIALRGHGAMQTYSITG